MNLSDALHAVSTPMRLPGVSDQALADRVNTGSGHRGGGMEPTVLDGGSTEIGVDVLRRLAQATRPLYTDGVYDLYTHWAMLRYLGVFEPPSPRGTPNFALSAAGRRVVGNQRRVLSEELGIGFAIGLAESWMRARVPGPYTPFRAIDIDMALTDGSIQAARAHKTVKAIGTRRPDYLLILDDPSIPGRFRVSVLECKGTKNATNSIKQLINASTQLRGVKVANRMPAGLAVGTVIGDNRVTFNALQTRSEVSSTDPYGRREETEGSDEVVDVDLEVLRSAPMPDIDRLDVPSPAVLASWAMAMSWASLGDFAGNSNAFNRWASGSLRNKLARDSGAQRDRVEEVAPDGTNLIGVRNVLTFPGGRLEIFFGVTAGVDRALTAGDPEQLLLEQSRVAGGSDAPERGMRLADRGDRVYSQGADGAALMLTPQ